MMPFLIRIYFIQDKQTYLHFNQTKCKRFHTLFLSVSLSLSLARLCSFPFFQQKFFNCFFNVSNSKVEQTEEMTIIMVDIFAKRLPSNCDSCDVEEMQKECNSQQLDILKLSLLLLVLLLLLLHQKMFCLKTMNALDEMYFQKIAK